MSTLGAVALLSVATAAAPDVAPTVRIHVHSREGHVGSVFLRELDESKWLCDLPCDVRVSRDAALRVQSEGESEDLTVGSEDSDDEIDIVVSRRDGPWTAAGAATLGSAVAVGAGAAAVAWLPTSTLDGAPPTGAYVVWGVAGAAVIAGLAMLLSPRRLGAEQYTVASGTSWEAAPKHGPGWYTTGNTMIVVGALSVAAGGVVAGCGAVLDADEATVAGTAAIVSGLLFFAGGIAMSADTGPPRRDRTSTLRAPHAWRSSDAPQRGGLVTGATPAALTPFHIALSF